MGSALVRRFRYFHDTLAMVQTFALSLQTPNFESTMAWNRWLLFDYIKIWYNRQRRDSPLGYVSPEQFEKNQPKYTSCLRNRDHSKVPAFGEKREIIRAVQLLDNIEAFVTFAPLLNAKPGGEGSLSPLSRVPPGPCRSGVGQWAVIIAHAATIHAQ